MRLWQMVVTNGRAVARGCGGACETVIRQVDTTKPFPIGRENGHTAPNSPSWLSCRLPRPRVWALLYGGGND